MQPSSSRAPLWNSGPASIVSDARGPDSLRAPRSMGRHCFQQSPRSASSIASQPASLRSPLSDAHVASLYTESVPQPPTADQPVNGDSTDAVPSSTNASKPTFSAMTLCGLMYSYAIGGAYGLENSLQSGGALLTILFVIFLPIIWGFPVALVVAELATAIPTNAGFLMWINVSFHKVVYFTMVLLTILLVFIDNALYPALFSDYMCTMVTCSKTTKGLMRAGMTFVTMILNIIGVEAVGWASVLITVTSVAPFVLMFIIHMIRTGGYVNTEHITEIPPHVDWVTFLTTTAWNLSGLEQAGSLAEEISNPQQTIMKAMIPLMLLVYVTYIPPIIAGVSIRDNSNKPEDWSKWNTGYWSDVAKKIGGEGFKVFTVVGSVISAFGLTMSAICTTSRNLSGMAETGAFPNIISDLLVKQNKRFGTPHWAIIINSVFTGLFSTLLSFGTLVKIDQACYGIRVLMIFLAAVKLRYTYPTLHRPFKIPLSNDRYVIFLMIPIMFCVALTVIAMCEDSQTLILCVGVIVGSVLVSAVYCRFFKPDGFDGKIILVEDDEDDDEPTRVSEHPDTKRE